MIYCALCGYKSHQILIHLETKHQMSAAQYRERFPHSPVISSELAESMAEIPALPPQPQEGRERQRKLFKFGDLEIEGFAERGKLTPVEDAHYHFLPQLDHLILGLNQGDKILIWGPTGSGKSQMLLQLAARINQEVLRVNLHGETSVSDFVGQWVIRGKEMRYQEGILPTAMRTGAWLLLDELDSALPSVLFILQAVLEEHGKLILTEKGSEIVAPHERFRVIATANTIGKGDDSGLYAGTEILNEAFLDRFATVIHLPYLSQEEEAKLLTEKVQGLKPAIASAMAQVAHDIREAFEKEEVYCSFSTRRLLNWGRKYTALKDVHKSAEITILNKLTDDDRRVVAEVIQRYFG